MATSALDSERTAGDIGGNSGSALPAPCPRFATRDGWEAWHQSLTWEQQLRRGDLDPPEHQHAAAEAAKADARRERRRAQRFDPDPFSYAHDRRAGPWPRIDQLEVPALSNTWRTDPSAGYSPGGFALRIRQIPHRELVEERMPRRALRDMEARLAWIVQSIEHDETAQRAALSRVLRERHRRPPEEEGSSTRCAMAWSHLVAVRCELAALRDLAKEARAEISRQRPQLTLF
jgi:hypothetical protein